MNGHVEVVKMLLDKGANVEAKSNVSLPRPCPLSSTIVAYAHTCMYDCAAMIFELASMIR